MLVLVGVALFVVLLVGLLAVPLTLEFELAWPRTPTQSVRLHWAFGLVRVRIPSPDSRAEPKPRKARKKKQRRKGSSRGSGSVLAAVRDGRFRGRLIKLARDLWGAVHKQSVLFRLRIGLGDPADTGRLWAFVGPVAGMLSAVRDATIEIQPEFFDPTFELDASGRVRVVPLHLVYLIVELMFSPSIWRGVRIMRKSAR